MLKSFYQKVLHRSGKKFRELSYLRDLISCIDWSQLKMSYHLNLDENAPDISHTQLDIKEQMELISSYQGSSKGFSDNTSLDIGFMCQRLSDIIPSSWSAYLIVDKVLSSLKKKIWKRKKFMQISFFYFRLYEE